MTPKKTLLLTPAMLQAMSQHAAGIGVPAAQLGSFIIAGHYGLADAMPAVKRLPAPSQADDEGSVKKSFRLDDDVLAALARDAERQGRPASQVGTAILAAFYGLPEPTYARGGARPGAGRKSGDAWRGRSAKG